MLSDAIYTVTCDNCGDTQEIAPEIFYRDYSGKTPFVPVDDESMEKEVRSVGWLVVDGKHYCCDECANPEAEESDEAETAA